MSVGGEVTGTVPDIGTFGCWEGLALRYVTLRYAGRSQ
jgi:hypothetical protein